MNRRPEDFGDGALPRAAALVYWVLMLQLFWLLAGSPALIAFLLLEPHPSNVPFFALAAVALGPAAAATVKAWHTFTRERDLAPLRAFWRGYRSSLGDVLRWWVPLLMVVAVLVLNLANVDALPVDPAVGSVLAVLTLVLLAVLGVVSGHALVISTLFSFRTRDVLRLSLYYLGRRPVASLGVLSLGLITAALSYAASDWVVAMLGSVFAALLLRNATGVITDIEEHFIR